MATPSGIAATAVSPDTSFGSATHRGVHETTAEARSTRTLAILTGHVATTPTHRLAIQSRLTSAGFELLAERLEEWKLPQDLDFLAEFLRHDDDDDEARGGGGGGGATTAVTARWARRLTRSPIYVLVLERRRAAELWNKMMGPDEEDDEADVAINTGTRVGGPTAKPPAPAPSTPEASDLVGRRGREGLRKTYGVAAVYGSTSTASAERQLAMSFPELASDEALESLEAEELAGDASGRLSAALGLSALPRAGVAGGDGGVGGGRLANDAGAAAEAEADSARGEISGDIEDEDLDGPLGQITTTTTTTTTTDNVSARHDVVVGEEELVYDDEGHAFEAATGREVELREELVVGDDSRTAEEERARRVEEATTTATTTTTSAEVGFEGESARRGATDARATTTASGKVFRARPLPASTRQADSQPRLSRAAALRMGVALPSPPQRRRPDSRASPSTAAAATGSETAKVGISGLARTAVALPKSLAQPSLAPRMNRAAAARTGGGVVVEAQAGAVSQSSSSTSATAADSRASPRPRSEVDFSNTPGHKRASFSGNVASLRSPSVVPRLNRAAAARGVVGDSTGAHGGGGGGNDGGRQGTESKSSGTASSPHHSRSSTRDVAPGRPASATAVRSSLEGYETKPPGAATKTTPTGTTAAGGLAARERRAVDFSNTPGHKRGSASLGVTGIRSLQPPATAPRANRASLARVGVGVGGGGDVGMDSNGDTSGSPVVRSSRRLSVSATQASSNGGGQESALGQTNPPSKTVTPQGIQATSPTTTRERRRSEVDFSSTPGHKRASSQLGVAPIASLAKPSIAPRTNLAASARRLSVSSASHVASPALGAAGRRDDASAAVGAGKALAAGSASRPMSATGVRSSPAGRPASRVGGSRSGSSLGTHGREVIPPPPPHQDGAILTTTTSTPTPQARRLGAPPPSSYRGVAT